MCSPTNQWLCFDYSCSPFRSDWAVWRTVASNICGSLRTNTYNNMQVICLWDKGVVRITFQKYPICQRCILWEIFKLLAILDLHVRISKITWWCSLTNSRQIEFCIFYIHIYYIYYTNTVQALWTWSICPCDYEIQLASLLGLRNTFHTCIKLSRFFPWKQ